MGFTKVVRSVNIRNMVSVFKPGMCQPLTGAYAQLCIHPVVEQYTVCVVTYTAVMFSDIV